MEEEITLEGVIETLNLMLREINIVIIFQTNQKIKTFFEEYL